MKSIGIFRNNSVIFTHLIRYYSPSELKFDLSKPAQYLSMGKYDHAADIYSKWFKDHQKDVFESKPLMEALTKSLPNMIRAFLGSDCDDEYKEHVKTIVDKGFLEIKDNDENNLFHLMAIENSKEGHNNQLYESILKSKDEKM